MASSVNFTLRIDAHFKDKLNEAARRSDRSLSNYIVHALRRSIMADRVDGEKGAHLRDWLDQLAACTIDDVKNDPTSSGTKPPQPQALRRRRSRMKT